MDVIPENSSIPQEGILGTDFLRDSASMDIRYDVQGYIKWNGITITSTRQNAVLIAARTAKVFYIKIKNPEVKTGSVPCLHFDKDLYMGNALVKIAAEKHLLKL